MDDFGSPLTRRALRPSRFLLFLFAFLTLGISRSLSETYEGPKDLKNHHFEACAVEEIPYVVRNEKRRDGFSGIAIDYLHLMQEKLQFTYKLNQWNGTFDQLLNHMEKCNPSSSGPDACICDLGVGPYAITDKRWNKAYFLWPFASENYRMVTNQKKLEVSNNHTWFVFQTFSGNVWIFICIGIFMHAFGTVLYGPFRPPKESIPHERGTFPARAAKLLWQIGRFPAAILYAYSHLLGNPFGESEQKTPSIHRSAWLILGLTSGLFLSTVYQSSLTVLLFESTKASKFRRIDDVINCAVSADTVAMVSSSATQEYWKNNVNTTARRSKCGWQGGGILVRDLQEGFDYIRDEKADFFFDLEGSVLYQAHANCDVYEPVGEPFFSTSVSFVVPWDTHDDVVHLLATETQLLKESDEFSSATILALRMDCPEVKDATITVGKLKLFFIMYVVVWAVLLGSRIVFLWRRKRDIQDGLGPHGADDPPFKKGNGESPSEYSSQHSTSAVTIAAEGSQFRRGQTEARPSSEYSIEMDVFP